MFKRGRLRACKYFNLNGKIPMKSFSLAVVMMALGLSSVVGVTGAQSAVRSEKSRELVKEAREYINKGELDAAIIQLKNALRADPDDGETRLMLGNLYLLVRNAVSAEKELKRAKGLGIEVSRVALPLGNAYLLQRKFDEVLQMLSVEDVREKDKPEAFLVVGNAFQGLGKVDKALEYFLKGEKFKDRDDKLSVAIARIYNFKGEKEKALEKVNHALEINPKNIQGLILRGELALKLEKPKDALSYFENALQYAPGNVTAMMKVASMLFEMKRDEEALEKLEGVFARVPRHPLGSYLAAVIYARANDAEKAKEYLENAGPALDKFPPALMLRGVINYSEKNDAQAIYHMSRLIEIVPNHIVARRVLGAALMRQGDAEQAVEVLDVVEKSGKADSIIYTLLGGAHMKLGNFEKGTAYYEKAVAEKPDESRLRTQLAMSKLAQGDTKAAELNLQEILEKDPNSRQATVFLTLIALRENNFAKALENADLVIKQMPENPTGYNLKGTAFMKSEKFDQARKLFNKALELNGDYHSARMNLAQLELRVDNKEGAKKIYNAILEQDGKYIGALTELARLASLEKDLKSSVAYMNKAIAIAPKRIDLRVKLSELYLEQRELEKARAASQQIIQDFPDQAAGYEASGKISLMMGDLPSAISNFEKLTALLGDNAVAYRLLGQAQVRSKDLPNARKTLTRALGVADDRDPILLDLVQLEISSQNYSTAHGFVKDIEEIRGDVWSVDFLKGRVFLAEEKFDKALDAFLKAREKGATGGKFVIILSNTYFVLKDFETGKVILTDWLKEKEDDNPVRLLLANRLLSENSYAGAIQQYEVVLTHDGDNVLTMNNLAWLYSQTGQLDKGRELAGRAYEKIPDNASVMDTYGWILVQGKDYKKGLEILRKAVARAPDMMELRYHLAVALKGVGRKTAARGELETVISSGEVFAGLEDAKRLLQELSGN